MGLDKSYTTELAQIPPWNHGHPIIAGPAVFGAGLGSDTLHPVPTLGRRPLLFSADGLPKGLYINSRTGVIQGKATTAGESVARVMVNNDDGSDEREIKVIIGDGLALTPPLGWNSWNCWHTSIDESRIRTAAEFLVSSGLAAHGYNYVNIDDGWQGQREELRGAMQPNEKFEDMRKLCADIHALGLRAGIYSTPWKISYGHFPGGSSGACVRCDVDGYEEKGHYFGERSHHNEDVAQWAQWGIDFLKYDWHPWDIPETQLMNSALKQCGRDIVYSLSNSARLEKAAYWMRLANCWRTTGDISDTWQRVAQIGFSQEQWAPFAGPGHWPDADMLVAGSVGWGNPRANRLTADEQIAHFTLWALLPSPLLLGCDLTALDEFTIKLTCNDEVLAINQDPLGKPARCVIEIRKPAGENEPEKHHAIYTKPLADGSIAVGIFNRAETPEIIDVPIQQLGEGDHIKARNVWARKDIEHAQNIISMGTAPHGAQLLRLIKER